MAHKDEVKQRMKDIFDSAVECYREYERLWQGVADYDATYSIEQGDSFHDSIKDVRRDMVDMASQYMRWYSDARHALYLLTLKHPNIFPDIGYVPDPLENFKLYLS